MALGFDPKWFEGFTLMRGELDREDVYLVKGHSSGGAVSDSLEALQLAVLGPASDGGMEGESQAGVTEIEYCIGVGDLLVRKVRGLFEVSGWITPAS